ncbi:MAG: alpha/beta hydrolase [Mangrovicoccus sp.]|nr:alpha/beta hydrolase [Mangrovicoccus sp.]
MEYRGHGRSSGGPLPDWTGFIDDALAVIEALDLRHMVGAGHSMGGHILIGAAARARQRFQRLILVDPVIMPPALYQMGDALPEGYVHPAAKRQGRFASAEEMQERFRDRLPYCLFTPAALQDYVRHGLRPMAEGTGQELRCAPEMEASVYVSSLKSGAIYEAIKQVPHPTLILRARPMKDWMAPDYTCSPTWPDLAGAFANGRDMALPELSHFLPMQSPKLVAEILSAELREAGVIAALGG